MAQSGGLDKGEKRRRKDAKKLRVQIGFSLIMRKRIDGFVKSPSAALRGNPAPLDNNPALGIQG